MIRKTYLTNFKISRAMITEDYCSYEVAKLLKEKGFDESTTFVWYQHLPVSLDCRNLVNKKARDYFYHDETTEHNSSYKNSRPKPKYIHGDIFSCPTHQMAMKWLREKYNLFIWIGLRRPNMGLPYCYELHSISTGEVIHIGGLDFGSYEQAVDAALKYCLTELI